MEQLGKLMQKTIESKKEYDKNLEEFSVELFTENFTYADKNMLEDYKERLSVLKDYKIPNMISKAIVELKKRAYPEVNGVKYYKDQIGKLSVELTDEEKIELDRRLYNECQPRLVYTTLGGAVPRAVENKVLKELFDLGVIAPMVTVNCDNCYDMIMIGNVKKGQSIQSLLGLDDSAEKDEIEEALYNSLYCNSCDDGYEVSKSMVEDLVRNIDKPTSFYRFQVVAKPDMTIDNL